MMVLRIKFKGWFKPDVVIRNVSNDAKVCDAADGTFFVTDGDNRAGFRDVLCYTMQQEDGPDA